MPKLNNDQQEQLRIFADTVNQIVVDKYSELFDTLTRSQCDLKKIVDLNELNLSKFLNVYAAIVQANGLDPKTAKLVCFTTGTKCINGEFMSLTGTSLNDW